MLLLLMMIVMRCFEAFFFQKKNIQKGKKMQGFYYHRSNVFRGFPLPISFERLMDLNGSHREFRFQLSKLVLLSYKMEASGCEVGAK